MVCAAAGMEAYADTISVARTAIVLSLKTAKGPQREIMPFLPMINLPRSYELATSCMILLANRLRHEFEQSGTPHVRGVPVPAGSGDPYLFAASCSWNACDTNN